MADWIKAADVLPPEDAGEYYGYVVNLIPVLVCGKFPGVRIARYQRHVEPDEQHWNRWRSECSEGWTIDGVSHWTKLPELPLK